MCRIFGLLTCLSAASVSQTAIVTTLLRLSLGAIVWWLENGQPASVEQLAAWLSQLNMTSAGLIFPPAPTR